MLLMEVGQEGFIVIVVVYSEELGVLDVIRGVLEILLDVPLYAPVSTIGIVFDFHLFETWLKLVIWGRPLLSVEVRSYLKML